MKDPNLQKWAPAAWALTEAPDKLPVPADVLTGEALDVVRFCQRHWEPVVGSPVAVTHPGLKSAVGNGAFSAGIGDETYELLHAFQAAYNEHQLLSSRAGAAPMQRAHFVLGELRSTLEWFFDDGKLDQGDAQLEALITAHDGAASQDAVALALSAFAALADRNADRLRGLGGFEPALIGEARGLVDQLREQSAVPTAVRAPEERQALELRNRIGGMLYERMQRVRTAARFVFRGQPQIVREVTSSYGRRQRAAHRSNGKAEAAQTSGRSGSVLV